MSVFSSSGQDENSRSADKNFIQLLHLAGGGLLDQSSTLGQQQYTTLGQQQKHQICRDKFFIQVSTLLAEACSTSFGQQQEHRTYRSKNSRSAEPSNNSRPVEVVRRRLGKGEIRRAKVAGEGWNRAEAAREATGCVWDASRCGGEIFQGWQDEGDQRRRRYANFF